MFTQIGVPPKIEMSDTSVILTLAGA
jgi:hypothetical protein